MYRRLVARFSRVSPFALLRGKPDADFLAGMPAKWQKRRNDAQTKPDSQRTFPQDAETWNGSKREEGGGGDLTKKAFSSCSSGSHPSWKRVRKWELRREEWRMEKRMKTAARSLNLLLGL
ncbi:semialdehyde dehydrogenase [Anopheles sinensis]|uniref:Semialdehyde dehydrogenase n=1 Tax=Anopheles sinensis TaxID=74873 RepID=A0A084VM13_ANOSI|nr:semialdehyde dehydrogenase [Anopheles sinensis]